MRVSVYNVMECYGFWILFLGIMKDFMVFWFFLIVKCIFFILLFVGLFYLKNNLDGGDCFCCLFKVNLGDII